MNSFTAWIISILLFIICIGLIYFQFTTDKIRIGNDTIIIHDTITYKPENINIIDTVTKIIKSNIYHEIILPNDIDSILVYKLINERDSINRTLLYRDIEENVILDTILNKDSIYAKYDILNRIWTLNYKFSPKYIPYDKIIYKNELYWYNRPEIIIPSTLLFGFIIGGLIF